MKYSSKYLIALFVMFITVKTDAQGLDDILFPDNVDDVNVTSATIHFLIPLAIVVGVVIGLKKLRQGN